MKEKCHHTFQVRPPKMMIDLACSKCGIERISFDTPEKREKFIENLKQK